MVHNSEIKINVGLDENRIPEYIKWTAEDAGADGIQQAKAMFLSMWDSQEQSTLRIDLWTKDMPVDQMKVFFHQTLMAMADTLERATEERKMAETMREFCAYFKEKLNL